MNSYKNYVYNIIKNNDEFKLQDLVNRGFNINGDNNDFKKSYLYYALSIYNYYMAEQLIKLGAKTNYKTDYFYNSVIYKALFETLGQRPKVSKLKIIFRANPENYFYI